MPGALQDFYEILAEIIPGIALEVNVSLTTQLPPEENTNIVSKRRLNKERILFIQ